MALSANTVWEIRASGSDSSGGGFVAGASGTDYSQQNAAQYTFTDLASTNGNAASPVVTSASHNFVAADVGNILQVTAGTSWTAGFYQIVSVATNAATLDRACGSAATLTAGTYAVGGALATPGKAAGAKVAGNSAWIQSGTYTFTTSTANVAGGPVNDTTGGSSGSAASRWEGYQTTRGDKGTKPIIAVPAAGTYTNVAIFTCNQSYVVIDNLAVDGGGNASTGMTGFAIGSSYTHGLRLKADRCAKGFTLTAGNNTHFERMEATRFTAYGFFVGNSISVLDSIAHGGTGTADGFQTDASTRLVRCLSYANPGYGFNSTSIGVTYADCIAYSNGSGGWSLGSVEADCWFNCIAYGNTGWGWNLPVTSQLARLMNCAGGSNTSGNYDNTKIADSGATKMVENFVTLNVGNPFTNAAAGDFSLNNTAGAGAACRAAGYPGVFPAGLATGYLDIGAVQHQDAGGGGSSIVVQRPIVANTYALIG